MQAHLAAIGCNGLRSWTSFIRSLINISNRIGDKICQVSMVTCMLTCFTKIIANFILPAESQWCRLEWGVTVHVFVPRFISHIHTQTNCMKSVSLMSLHRWRKHLSYSQFHFYLPTRSTGTSLPPGVSWPLPSFLRGSVKTLLTTTCLWCPQITVPCVWGFREDSV